MDPLKFSRPGDPVKLAAAQLNRLNEMIAAPRQPAEQPPRHVERPYTFIYAKNIGSTDYLSARPVQIVGLQQGTDAASAAWQYRDTPVVSISDAWTRNGFNDGEPMYSGITVDPIRTGDIGRLAVGGVVQAKVFIEDYLHTHAGLTSYRTNVLTSSFAGDYAILYKPNTEAAVGEVADCLVRIGHSSSAGVFVRIGHLAWPRNTTQLVLRNGLDEPATQVSCWNPMYDIPAGSTASVGRLGFAVPIAAYSPTTTFGRYCLIAWAC
jgi:hypothetical protein